MKPSLQSLLTILLVTMLLVLAFSIRPVRSVDGNWWNDYWTCRRAINITENSGYSLTDYPVEVTFRHEGHVQTDGRDIRVVENNVEVPSYLTNLNSSWATIMFETNLSELSTKTVYIYYGNSTVSAPNFPLVPLTISSDQHSGHAVVDNRIYIGWNYVAWGVQPGWFYVGGNLVYIDNSQAVLWTDFRMDFDHDNAFEESEDLLTDFDMWKGGIGRSHVDAGSYVGRTFGLGDFQQYVQTPIFVDLVFADSRLRVFRGQNFIETRQADRLDMDATSWDFAKYEDGLEENIIDGLNTNGPPSDPMWNTLCNSSINPGWMAYRNSMTGYVIGGIGFNTSPNYLFHFSAKESHAWDRLIMFDYTSNQMQDPYDQPADCRIYWYADGSNNYSGINKTATTLSNSPEISIQIEEAIPEYSSAIIMLSVILFVTAMIILSKKRFENTALRKSDQQR